MSSGATEAATYESVVSAAKADASQPLMVVSLDRAAIVWANRLAAAIYETADLDALTAMVLGVPAARGLVGRLRRLTPSDPDQLERSALVSGFHVRPVTMLCRAAGDGETGSLVILRIAAPHAPAASGAPPAVIASEPPEAPVEQAVEAPLEAPTDIPAPEPAVAENLAHSDTRTGETEVKAATLLARFAPATTLRFLWECDDDCRLTKVGPQWAEVVGSSAPALGDSLIDALHAVSPEAARAVESAWHERRGWSGLSVAWPIADTDAAVAIVLGGAMQPGAGSRLRGFGSINLAQTTTRVAPLAEPTPETPVAEPDEHLDGDLGHADAAPQANAPDEGEIAPDGDPAPTAEAPAQAPTTSAPVVIPMIAPGAARPVVTDQSKVVNLLTFKTNGQPSLYGAPIKSGPKAVPDETDETPVEAPLWSESPGSDREPPPPSSELTHAEQDNLREIRRALSAEGPGDAVADPIETDHATTDENEPPSLPAPPANPRVRAERSEALLDHLPVGLLVTQGDHLPYANRAALDSLGFDSAEALLAAGGLAGIFGDTADATSAHRTVRRRDGTIRPAEIGMRAIEWDGAPATLISLRSAGDEEAEARAEAIRLDLYRSQGTVRDLVEALDAAATAVFTLNEHDRVMSINAPAEAFFGYDQNEVVGDASDAFVVPEQRPAWARFLAAARLAHETGTITDSARFLARKRNGDLADLTVRLRPLSEHRLCVIWLNPAAENDGRREPDAARREAERSNALKSEFLAKVSHEIRTPLNAILGFAEVMRDERLGPIENERYKDYLRDIHAAGTHVMSLVNDLLDLSRIESGRLDLKLTGVNANAIVGDCVSTLQNQANRERIIVRQSLAPRLPLVLADERTLRQIVLNLLSNAVKFNEPGGQVIVSTAAVENDGIAIRIRDTGFGMSEDEIATAMEPFRQLPTPKANAGSGLGLPLTKALVEASQASMTIKSRPQEGTLVEVVFQQAPAEAVSVPAE